MIKEWLKKRREKKLLAKYTIGGDKNQICLPESMRIIAKRLSEIFELYSSENFISLGIIGKPNFELIIQKQGALTPAELIAKFTEINDELKQQLNHYKSLVEDLKLSNPKLADFLLYKHRLNKCSCENNHPLLQYESEEAFFKWMDNRIELKRIYQEEPERFSEQFTGVPEQVLQNLKADDVVSIIHNGKEYSVKWLNIQDLIDLNKKNTITSEIKLSVPNANMRVYNSEYFEDFLNETVRKKNCD